MLTTPRDRFADHANDIITHVNDTTRFSDALFFSAGIKKTEKKQKTGEKNQFLHLHLVSAPSREMEFIN